MIEILELSLKYFKATINCVLKKTEENKQNGWKFGEFWKRL